MARARRPALGHHGVPQVAAARLGCQAQHDAIPCSSPEQDPALRKPLGTSLVRRMTTSTSSPPSSADARGRLLPDARAVGELVGSPLPAPSAPLAAASPPTLARRGRRTCGPPAQPGWVAVCLHQGRLDPAAAPVCSGVRKCRQGLPAPLTGPTQDQGAAAELAVARAARAGPRQVCGAPAAPAACITCRPKRVDEARARTRAAGLASCWRAPGARGRLP